ncbi:MAG TPA: glycosyltransferase family 39 protein, partial [Thermoanaerobaculia bacterium]|nr:glycosyltransferase family 39 protein [Thermoanaerobaculia bacterium]
MWRVGRWALGIPLWRDEANLGLNILGRSFADLARPLDYFQVAPLLFLWIEKAVTLTLGAGDWAVRLVPTLASVGALLLFARLAVRAVAPLAAACATGFLAAAYYTTRYGSELKPYSVDLLASVLILSLALEALDRPRAPWAPALLVSVTPFLVGASYPAVFVAAAAGLVLAAHAVRERDGRFLLLAALHLVVTAGAFLLFFVLATSGQERVTGPDMRVFWAPAFPPANPARFPLWLLDIHAGNLSAYPVGGKYGGSTVTFLLTLAGGVALIRLRRLRLVWLLLLPFLLNLVAAALHRYPYGDYARVAQHLAPAICILAGCGIAALLERIPERLAWRRHTASATLGLLA